MSDETIVAKKRIGASAKKRWTPKEWTNEYTAIVAMSCTGASNVAIGAYFNYTPVHISSILNAPEAKQIIQLISKRTLEHSLDSIPKRLDRLRTVALSRVEALMENDDFAAKSPFQIFDRALKVVQATGVVASDDEPTRNVTNIQQNNLILNDTQSKALTEGLALAREVAAKHANISTANVEPVKIVV